MVSPTAVPESHTIVLLVLKTLRLSRYKLLTSHGGTLYNYVGIARIYQGE